MAVTLRGYDQPPSSWYSVWPHEPPRRGYLIVMALPDGQPTPPGWTRAAGGCWRYADGIETGFPFPAAWYST